MESRKLSAPIVDPKLHHTPSTLGAVNPVNGYSLRSLVNLQNLAAVCHSVWAYVGPNI